MKVLSVISKTSRIVNKDQNSTNKNMHAAVTRSLPVKGSTTEDCL